ncbi:MAG: molybdopterin molybdotransferase MoeA [Actinobacteria bacterium]|nr:molybdopterin molybdotransferase MoeA [Actinomycetota bacterium]
MPEAGGRAGGLVSVDEARRRVLGGCRRLEPREFLASEALGLVLAGPVRSNEQVPPFANSAMDGYAVRSVDVGSAPAKLHEVGVVMAGDAPGALTIGPGEAARIMTGAPLPFGADAVCMVEHTHLEHGWVVIEEAVSAGTHVRPAGDDIEAGDEVFGAGDQLGAPHLAVLAAIGASHVVAYPRPRVGVLSSGDELVSGRDQLPGPLPPGKLRDSNRPGLLAQLRTDGFEAADLGIVADDALALAPKLAEAAELYDAVLTSGGVSMGDRDMVKVVLGQLGGQQACWLQVAVKPAKPLAFSTLGRGVPVFGLPGNPVSALVSYELFARPALRYMAGHKRLGRPTLSAVCAAPFVRRPDGKVHLMRAVVQRVGGQLLARPARAQGSHQLRSLAEASALALVPDGDGLSAGDPVELWMLDLGPLSEGEGWAPC